MQFGVSMKPVTLINICLNEPNTEVCVGKYFSDTFPIQNDLEGDAL
jgi:hypothetical protein